MLNFEVVGKGILYLIPISGKLRTGTLVTVTVGHNCVLLTVSRLPKKTHCEDKG